MKKKLITIVLILFLFIFVLTVYMVKRDDKKEHYFKSSEIKNQKTDDETDINDKEVYKNNIITENLLKLEYSFFHEKESITGNVYIGEDQHLYIYDSNKNKNFRVSTFKFKTMYSKNYHYSAGVYVYLISEDGKIYIMSLEGNDITKTNIYDYKYIDKFTNFVDIEFKHDMDKPGNTLFAMSEDGKIYDINTGLRYDANTISLYNSIYVYNDKTMTNAYGHSIENENGNKYKIKYIFSTVGSNKLFKDAKSIVIVTEDNEFIYFNEEMMYVYEFDKKVKDVKFDKYYPYINGNLEITFEDEYKVEFTASCNQYYCVNEFAE